MPPPRTFADVEYDGQPRQTRRERFLQTHGRVDAMGAAGSAHPPGLSHGRTRSAPRTRWPYCCGFTACQLFYNLSDPAMEDALYDSVAVQWFVGLTARDSRPDDTTIVNFRHLLEQHDVGAALLAETTQHLASWGVRLREGTIVDVTIIDAPASTKNRAQQRDPEMHQVKKGKQWYFGMKAHIGVDAQTGLVHSVATTAAHVADVTQVPQILNGGETRVWGTRGIRAWTGARAPRPDRGLVGGHVGRAPTSVGTGSAAAQM